MTGRRRVRTRMRLVATMTLSTILAGALAGCDGSGASGSAGSEPPASDGSGDGAALPAIALAADSSSLAGILVGAPTLVGRRRLSRTDFEYTYSVEISNPGTQRFLDVAGTVTSASPSTTVIDPALSFGDLAAGATTTSTDTFSIRQDRLSPVASADLRIALAGRIADPDPAVGILLEGPPGSPATSALFDLTPIAAEPADIVDGALLTRLDWVLARGATVGQVNSALAAVEGGIVGMRANRPALVVAVPRQTDADALARLAESSRRLPGIALAFPGRRAEVALAPPPPANQESDLGYLRDAGFPAAWNARAAAGDCAEKTTVIVADLYHRPTDSLYVDFASQVPGVTDRGTGSVPSSDFKGYHGFDVWTTLAARLDATTPNGAMPFPECLRPEALQLEGLTDYASLFAIEDAIPSEGHVVVNHSISFPVCADCDRSTAGMTASVMRGAVGAFARSFLHGVRDRVLLVQATGNYADDRRATIYPGLGSADYVSGFAVAARSDAAMTWVEDANLWRPDPGACGETGCLPSLLPSAEEADLLRALLEDLQFAAIPPPDNVMLVGSATRDLTNSPSSFSNEPADVRAVGENLPVLLGVPVQGTSFAAPQVSALAAYLWVLSRELREAPVGETLSAIRANASATGMISAYATVLSLDSGRALSPANSPIRLAILNVDDGGVSDPDDFDQADLAAFLAALRPGGLDIDPSVRDDSRHDLNGDGFTGGSGTAALDLDPEDSPRFGRRHLSLVTTEVLGELETYDERSVTDIDALCYYAHSPLYTGDLEARHDLLYAVCPAGEATWVGSWTRSRQFVSDAGTSLAASTNSTENSSVSVRAVLIDGGFAVDGSALYSSSGTSVFRLSTTGTRTCRRTGSAQASGPANGITLGPTAAFIAGDAIGTATRTDTCVNPPISETFETSIGVRSDPALLATEFDENGEPTVYSINVNQVTSGPWGTGGSFTETLTIEGMLTRLR